jgi:hypothetical protein
MLLLTIIIIVIVIIIMSIIIIYYTHHSQYNIIIFLLCKIVVYCNKNHLRNLVIQKDTSTWPVNRLAVVMIDTTYNIVHTTEVLVCY